MRHLWHDKKLHLNLRLRLYKSCVCSVLTYGSEAWHIDSDTARALNGANAGMVSIITGKSPHQEASKKWQTFDLVAWVRARRLQWLGHILRMGPERKLKQAVFEMFKKRSQGDLLMDAPKHNGSWRMLCTMACAREQWRMRVRLLTQTRISIELGSHVEEGKTVSFTINA